MSDLEVKYLSVNDLVPYANNPRTHSEKQVTQVASSIKEFGFNNPILIDEGKGIIAGHGRLAAAKKLGLEAVPTITLEGLTEAQRKAYVIADNKLTENSEWDYDLLTVEVERLKELDFDLDLTGFDEDELNALLEPTVVEGLTDEDEVPEAPENPITKRGDVWILGSHRLMCGDSTCIDDVDRLMGGKKADLVFTDPPYGMSYGGGRAAGSTQKGAIVKAHGEIIGDDLRGNDLLEMVKDAIQSALVSKKDGAAVYVCFTWRTYSEFESALDQCGLDVKACIVWDKKSIGLGMSNYRPQHEFIFYCEGQWFGDKSQSDVWYMSRGSTAGYVHPTQKPVELVEKAITNSSKTGDIVIDVFGGSGSTLIACEKTNRDGCLMELDPKYCDVIVDRWQSFTGKTAQLDRPLEVMNG